MSRQGFSIIDCPVGSLTPEASNTGAVLKVASIAHNITITQRISGRDINKFTPRGSTTSVLRRRGVTFYARARQQIGFTSTGSGGTCSSAMLVVSNKISAARDLVLGLRDDVGDQRCLVDAAGQNVVGSKLLRRVFPSQVGQEQVAAHQLGIAF